MPLKELGLRLLSAPYELIFKEKMSNEARRLILSTSYVGIGTLFGSMLTLIFSILAARTLGPDNFGVLGLVMTVAGILSLSMGIGATPMIRYGSEAHHSVQVSIVSTSYIQIALLTTASACIYVLFSAPLSYVFGVPAE